MHDEKFEVSKTSATAGVMWLAAVGLWCIGGMTLNERALLLCLSAAIMLSGLATAWTVRGFMRKCISEWENAFQLGYDKGRSDAREIPLQRVH